jgi:hypothetical protein
MLVRVYLFWVVQLYSHANVTGADVHLQLCHLDAFQRARHCQVICMDSHDTAVQQQLHTVTLQYCKKHQN